MAIDLTCEIPPRTLVSFSPHGNTMRGGLQISIVFNFIWSRSGAFVPAAQRVAQECPSRKWHKCPILRAVPDRRESEVARKALEQAAKLRQEVADLEKELASGKPKVDDIEQEARASLVEDMESSSPFSLAPSCWLVMMDIGREKGTWMPQNWGISCRRVEVDLLIQFLPGGRMEAKVDSPFVDMTVTPGKWIVGAAEGSKRRRPSNSLGDLTSDTCRFWVETSGLTKGDVTIPAGKLYFAVPAWGGKLSRRGIISVRQRRWLVREESRILGVSKTELIVPDAQGRMPARPPRPRTPPFPDGFRNG